MSLLLAVQSAGSGTSFSGALVESADALAAAVGPRVAASLASTEGADTLAASVSLASATLNVSAALAEGADVLAAAAGPLVRHSAALSEGPDTLAAQVGPRVAVSLASTEGADSLAAAAGAFVSVSAALSDGADVLAAAVSVSAPTLQFSANLAEGEDVLAAQIGTQSPAGGYDDDKKTKRRFVVERNGKLVVYASQASALRALEEQGSSEPPTEEVDLPVVQAYAEVAGRIEDYNAAFNSRHFEQLMALFDQVRAQLDEEDVEMLLLAA